MSFEFLHQTRLFGSRIFDCLCLVDNGELPRNFQQLGNTAKRTITGDDEIDIGEQLRIEPPQLGRRHCGSVNDDGSQSGRECFDLRHPVGEQ